MTARHAKGVTRHNRTIGRSIAKWAGISLLGLVGGFIQLVIIGVLIGGPPETPSTPDKPVASIDCRSCTELRTLPAYSYPVKDGVRISVPRGSTLADECVRDAKTSADTEACAQAWLGQYHQLTGR